MERRKANRDYVKLWHKTKLESMTNNDEDEKLIDVAYEPIQEEEEEEDEFEAESKIDALNATVHEANSPPIAFAFQRSRSMRASFRLLKGKLQQNTQAILQSPFKKNYGNLISRNNHRYPVSSGSSSGNSSATINGRRSGGINKSKLNNCKSHNNNNNNNNCSFTRRLSSSAQEDSRSESNCCNESKSEESNKSKDKTKKKDKIRIIKLLDELDALGVIRKIHKVERQSTKHNKSDNNNHNESNKRNAVNLNNESVECCGSGDVAVGTSTELSFEVGKPSNHSTDNSKISTAFVATANGRTLAANKAKIDEFILKLPSDLMANGGIPRKACKLLQIPEEFCAKNVKQTERQQDNEFQLKAPKEKIKINENEKQRQTVNKEEINRRDKEEFNENKEEIKERNFNKAESVTEKSEVLMVRDKQQQQQTQKQQQKQYEIIESNKEIQQIESVLNESEKNSRNATRANALKCNNNSLIEGILKEQQQQQHQQQRGRDEENEIRRENQQQQQYANFACNGEVAKKISLENVMQEDNNNNNSADEEGSGIVVIEYSPTTQAIEKATGKTFNEKANRSPTTMTTTQIALPLKAKQYCETIAEEAKTKHSILDEMATITIQTNQVSLQAKGKPKENFVYCENRQQQQQQDDLELQQLQEGVQTLLNEIEIEMEKQQQQQQHYATTMQCLSNANEKFKAPYEAPTMRRTNGKQSLNIHDPHHHHGRQLIEDNDIKVMQEFYHLDDNKENVNCNENYNDSKSENFNYKSWSKVKSDNKKTSAGNKTNNKNDIAINDNENNNNYNINSEEIYENFAKLATHGIYGTTRMKKTAITTTEVTKEVEMKIDLKETAITLLSLGVASIDGETTKDLTPTMAAGRNVNVTTTTISTMVAATATTTTTSLTTNNAKAAETKNSHLTEMENKEEHINPTTTEATTPSATTITTHAKHPKATKTTNKTPVKTLKPAAMRKPNPTILAARAWQARKSATTTMTGTTKVSTTMKTATIRKPMPYLNSHNILPNRRKSTLNYIPSTLLATQNYLTYEQQQQQSYHPLKQQQQQPQQEEEGEEKETYEKESLNTNKNNLKRNSILLGNEAFFYCYDGEDNLEDNQESNFSNNNNNNIDDDDDDDDENDDDENIDDNNDVVDRFNDDERDKNNGNVILRRPSPNSHQQSNVLTAAATTTTANSRLYNHFNDNWSNNIDSEEQKQFYHHQNPLNYNKSNNNIASSSSSSFRWSEQLTQNIVSLAKIRSSSNATNCNSQEMEFLLPHTNNNNNNNNNNNSKNGMSTTRPKTMHVINNLSNDQIVGVGSNPIHSNHALANLENEKCTKILGLTIHGFHSHHNKKDSDSQQNHHHHNHHQNQLQQQQQHQSQQHTENNKEGNKMKITDENHKSKPYHNSQQQQQLQMSQQLQQKSLKQQQQLQLQQQQQRISSSNNIIRTKCGNTPHRPKMSKKQLKLAQAQWDKLTQINLHLHALFSAVEHGHLDKARTIIESTDVDVNSINSDGLSALDVAVLSNNRSMTKMLLQHGAVEGSQFSKDNIGTKLNALLKDAESRIQDLSCPSDAPGPQSFAARPSISSIIIGNTSSSVTGCTGNEIDKQIGIWERRVKGLRRMQLGWDQTTRPDAPASVTVDVTGENSIALQILEPFEGAIGTKFKVQWSTRADFSNIVGERDILDWTGFHGNMGAQCFIGNLTQGRRYFIRAACGNVKGWGPYKTSIPASVVPSSWRDLNNREDRYIGRQHALESLFTAVRLARPADVSELTLEPTGVQRRNPKKKTTIKQLFSVASKFHKNLKRGIYLASIIYCEDKVLVTSEDFLPVIEIDETYPGSLNSDYHWLMKVACTWEDVKSLRTDMERNLTSAVNFRTKLLSAVCQMQSALSLNDLGQLYYKPLRDSQGTIVLTCIQTLKSQKSVSILNSRWLPVNKLQKKVVALHEDYSINDMLISSINEQIHYHQASMQRLSPGLYLGYLKMQCSVDQIQVVVPVKTPNVLPHYKVRDNSHITAEEWQILKRGTGRNSNGDGGGGGGLLPMQLEFNANSETTTEVQRLFLYDLTNAAHKLFSYMNIKPEDAITHRLYDIEVIEHSKDISFLVICPSVELTCAAPGQSELLLQRDDLVSLSIQAFEMIHLRTYQPGIIHKYARLSCILELDTALANHSQREAFSTSEMQTAKERLAKLQELSANLNAVWKSVRWLMDVIAFARDKNAQPSVAMKEILDFSHLSDDIGSSSQTKQQLLQLPIRDCKLTKTGPGRGSWPGPGNSESGSNLEVEHSKSEQNLGLTAVTPITIMPSVTSSGPMQQLTSHPMTIAATANTKSETPQHLQVGGGGIDYGSCSSDTSVRKNSGDSVASQYTTPSCYSGGADSAASSSNELGTIFSIPPSRSEDALAETGMKHIRAASAQHRKRTNSNIAHTSAANTPLITVHTSSSVPYLAHSTLASSNLSLSNHHSKLTTVSAGDSLQVSSGMSKVKAASSVNLRESGGQFLKSTLSALQSEIRNCDEKPSFSTKPISSSNRSLTHQSSEEEAAVSSTLSNVDSQQASTSGAGSSSGSGSAGNSGIIQVYTAYNTGLASGTSLKLHVTPKTTAREVINLVVKQLNMATVLKGNHGPIYSAEMLDNFCLVAVIGARERCLRDDFKPLLLQNPWKKGRLYVRQKHELLAAIEHANRKSHLI